MKMMGDPISVIELDLYKTSKQGLWLTLGATFFLFILHFLFLLFTKADVSFTFSLWKVGAVVVGYLLLIVAHELFHLIGFRFFANVPWKKMSVGVNLKLGIAYATTNELMTNKAIRKALLLPFWTTGVLPALAGLYYSNGVLLILGGLLIGGAAGDFAMFRELRRYPDDWLVKDDPAKPRLYLYETSK